MQACDLNFGTDLHCSRQILALAELAEGSSCPATPSTNAFNAVACHHAPRLPHANPHRTRGTTASHLPRFPCMGSLLSSGFRAATCFLACFLACFLDRFLCSTWNPVSSPRPAVLQSQRAQELSRFAVAPILRHTPTLPGHTLTASSTPARLVRSG